MSLQGNFVADEFLAIRQKQKELREQAEKDEAEIARVRAEQDAKEIKPATA